MAQAPVDRLPSMVDKDFPTSDSERPQAPDAVSPTTLVLNYIRSQGLQPTSENVRRVLEANAREPGVIPGLVSDRPATDAEDQAAMAAAGRGRPRGNTGPIYDQSNQDTGQPKVDQSNTASAPGESPRGDPTTSAQPSSDMGPLGLSVLLGVPATGLATASKLLPAMGGGGEPIPTPGGSVPPPVDPGGGRVLQGIRDNPVSPMTDMVTQALEGGPRVSGVSPVSPETVAAAPRGPTTSTAGAEPPVMPSEALRAQIRARGPGMGTPLRALRYLRP